MILEWIEVNPAHLDPRQREKINLNFCFYTSLWCQKRFYEDIYKKKVFVRPNLIIIYVDQVGFV